MQQDYNQMLVNCWSRTQTPSGRVRELLDPSLLRSWFIRNWDSTLALICSLTKLHVTKE